MPFDPKNPFAKPSFADAIELVTDRFTATGNMPEFASVQNKDGTFPAPTHFSDQEWYTYSALKWTHDGQRIVLLHTYPTYPLGVYLKNVHRIPSSDRSRLAVHRMADFVREARAIVNALTTSAEKQDRIAAYQAQGVYLQ